jgi:hypothetical protein
VILLLENKLRFRRTCVSTALITIAYHSANPRIAADSVTKNTIQAFVWLTKSIQNDKNLIQPHDKTSKTKTETCNVCVPTAAA